MKINTELLKKIAKKGSSFILVGSLLVGGNPVIAENEQQDMSIVYAAEKKDILEAVNITGQFGVNLYMDDKRFIPTDVNGYEVYPFIVDGTTYVPLRAVSTLFNADVKWDDINKCVRIDKNGNKKQIEHAKKEKTVSYQGSCVAYKGANLYIDNQHYVPTDTNGIPKDIYIINGTTYVPLRAISNAFGVEIIWNSNTNSVFLGNHKNFGLTVENINEFSIFKEAVLNFYKGSSSFFRSEKRLDDGNIQYIMNSRYHLSIIISYLMNEDYCDIDILQKSFEDISENTFDWLKYTYKPFLNSIYSKQETENSYDWSSAIVNTDYVNFLTNLQQVYHSCRKSGDYTEFVKIYESYFDGTSGTVCYGNSHPIIDYIVSTGVKYEYVATGKSANLYYYSVTNICSDAEANIVKNIENLSENLYSKQLVKN